MDKRREMFLDVLAGELHIEDLVDSLNFETLTPAQLLRVQSAMPRWKSALEMVQLGYGSHQDEVA